MVGYNSDDNALTLGDDDSLKVGDYEVEYSADSDEFQARYGRPIGGEAGAHGEVKGAEYVPNSQVGDNSILLSGEPEVITAPHQSKLNLNNVTISAWINVDREFADMSAAYPNIIEKGGGGPTGSYTLGAVGNDNKFGLRISTGTDDSQVTYTTSLTADTWVHVVGTYDGSTIRVYEDGVEQASTESTVSINQNLSPLNIGKSLEGLLDDTRIYDRALSESEVTDLFNGVDVTDGLVARYDFEYPETPDVAIDSTGDAFPKNSIPRNTSGSLVPQGLAESVSAGEALADDGNTYETVQDAVDAASGWVFVGPGTFNESVNITTAGLTLEGCGYDSLITHNVSSEVTVKANAENVSVKNIRISSGEYRALETDAGKLIAENVYIDGASETGIQLGGTSENIVSNCTVSGGNNSIQASNQPNNIIINNTVLGSDDDGIESYGGDNTIISGNVILNPASRGVHILNSSSDNIISQNRIHNAGNDGISVTGNDNIIANNRISDSTNEDIDDNGTGTVLDDNLTGPSN